MGLFGIKIVEKVRKNNKFFYIFLLKYSTDHLDEQIRLNRSEYLVLEIQVPTYCVGSIIGKGGEVIKRVRKQKENIHSLQLINESI